jgi:hypothetical protein
MGEGIQINRKMMIIYSLYLALGITALLGSLNSITEYIWL